MAVYSCIFYFQMLTAYSVNSLQLHSTKFFKDINKLTLIIREYYPKKKPVQDYI